MSKNFKKTLGQLFHKMKDDLNIADEVKQEIEAALQLRNFLIHNYFWERMLQFNTSAGRQAMLEELYHACTVFQAPEAVYKVVYLAIRTIAVARGRCLSTTGNQRSIDSPWNVGNGSPDEQEPGSWHLCLENELRGSGPARKKAEASDWKTLITSILHTDGPASRAGLKNRQQERLLKCQASRVGSASWQE